MTIYKNNGIITLDYEREEFIEAQNIKNKETIKTPEKIEEIKKIVSSVYFK